MSGPICSTEAAAITAWNTRTIPDPEAFMEAARGMREALGDVRKHFDGELRDKDWMETERLTRTALATFDAAQGEQ